MSSHATDVPKIQNIKFHFRVKNVGKLNGSIADLIDQKLNKTFPSDQVLNLKHNFCVYKHHFVYTIFFNTGFINCTKVRDYSQIVKAIEEFKFIFKFSVEDFEPGVTIDNTTVTGCFNKKLDLIRLKQLINQGGKNCSLFQAL